MSIDHDQIYRYQNLQDSPKQTPAGPTDLNFNRRHCGSCEGRLFENSRHRLSLVTESQNSRKSIVPIPSCRDKKYGYAVDAALTQFRMHPVRVASFKKDELLNDHENDTVVLFFIFLSFLFLSLSLSFSLYILLYKYNETPCNSYIFFTY